MKNEFNLGIFGLGTVGTGVVRLVSEHRDLIAGRVGAPVRISKAVVSDVEKKRGIDLSDIRLSSDPAFILDDPDIDVVIEVIGGLDAAETVILGALARGKSVVTANKAVLAERGQAIFPAAHDARGHFGFESSVGTAIPIIRTLREGFSGDEVLHLSGIINGTSNYILTRMSRDGLEFDEALEKAQARGLAEPDPTLDIQGVDAAHKLIIMMDLAFGGSFDFSRLHTEGISGIRAVDIRYAAQLGYVIKHAGFAGKTGQGIEARVHPVLVPEDHILSSVNDAFNAIAVSGKFAGPSLVYGLGAGPGPTAAGILSDVIDACRHGCSRQFSPVTISLADWQPKEIVPMDRIRTAYYLRFRVQDVLGVLASISHILAENRISVRSVIQEGEAAGTGGPVDVVLITHEALEADVRQALTRIHQEPFLAGDTQLIRIHKGFTSHE